MLLVIFGNPFTSLVGLFLELLFAIVPVISKIF